MSQIWVLASLLVMGAVSIISLVWAFYLGGKLQGRPSPKHYEVRVEGAKVFSDTEIAAISQQAQAGLQEVIGESSKLLRSALAVTINSLTGRTQEMATTMLSEELKKYQTDLASLRKDTIEEFNTLQKQMEQRSTELSAELEQLVAKDRQERMEAFNARIADVVSSYLVEALDKGIDLGAQSKYIVHTLETHKEDIKKDILA